MDEGHLRARLVLVVLLRQFADQAGFALEQVERQRAQAEAARREEETRRLQEITAKLSLASTPTDVADTCLEHALDAVGAEAGFVVLVQQDAVVVDIVSSRRGGTRALGTVRARCGRAVREGDRGR